MRKPGQVNNYALNDSKTHPIKMLKPSPIPIMSNNVYTQRHKQKTLQMPDKDLSISRQRRNLLHVLITTAHRVSCLELTPRATVRAWTKAAQK